MSTNLDHVKNAHEGIRLFGSLSPLDPAYGLLKEALKLQGSWNTCERKRHVVDLKFRSDNVVVQTVYQDDLSPAGTFLIPTVVFEMPTIEEGLEQARTLALITQARAELIEANHDHERRVSELNKRITILSRVAARRQSGEKV